MIQIDPAYLFRLVGEQHVELLVLRAQLAASQQATLDAAAENTRLRAELAAREEAANRAAAEVPTDGP